MNLDADAIWFVLLTDPLTNQPKSMLKKHLPGLPDLIASTKRKRNKKHHSAAPRDAKFLQALLDCADAARATLQPGNLW